MNIGGSKVSGEMNLNPIVDDDLVSETQVLVAIYFDTYMAYPFGLTSACRYGELGIDLNRFIHS